MKLRVTVTLINQRQVNVETEPDVHPGDLKAQVFAAAKRSFGTYDEMRIGGMEEVTGGVVKRSAKWAGALRVARSQPQLFPASVTWARDDLYRALGQQGYTWDKMVMAWQREEATHAPDQ